MERMERDVTAEESKYRVGLKQFDEKLAMVMLELRETNEMQQVTQKFVENLLEKVKKERKGGRKENDDHIFLSFLIHSASTITRGIEGGRFDNLIVTSQFATI
jgi:hypothetical protein